MEGADWRITKEEHAFRNESETRWEIILNDMIHCRIYEDYKLSVHVHH
jgi:hypothetical protein